MPTFLDLGLLEHVRIIFPFLFVWVVTYSLLEWREILGKNQSLHSVIAFIVALMTLFAPPVVAIIQYMIPWYAMLLIFSLFLILFYRLFGVPDDKITDIFLKSEYKVVATYWVILVSLAVLGLAVGQVFFAGSSVYVGDGQQQGLAESLVTTITGENIEPGVATSRGDVNFIATIFHPKVLGMIFVLIVAAIAIKLLAGDPIK